MQNLQKYKENKNIHVLRVNCKTRFPSNVLKTTKNLLGDDQFKKHIGVMVGDITPLHLGKALDKCVHDHNLDPRMTSVTGWYTITITDCLNIPNSSILLALKYAMTPLRVELFNFKRNEGSEGCKFLVDNKLIANRMMRLNGKITVLYTTKVINLHVQSGIPPTMFMDMTLTSSLTAAITAAILSRYDATSRSLHLTRFHAAPELLGHFCALHVLPMMQAVLQIVAYKFPQLRVLQLRDNYLCTLRAFDKFPRTSLPNLQVLDVSSNNINGMMELKNLRDMRLQLLDLTSNPLTKIPERQLRAMLPHVDHLRINNNVPSPLSENYSGADSSGRNFCFDFAKDYYTIFNDMSRRKELETYYDGQPMISLTLPKELLTKDSAYIKLFDPTQLQTRASIGHCSRLFVGKVAAMHVICHLPEMQINFEKYQLYIHSFNNTSRVFTMTGCFQEINSSGFLWRNYTRQFVLRCGNANNWKIHSDILQINQFPEQQTDCNAKNFDNQAKIEPLIEVNNQLEELNKNFDNTMQFNKEPERSTPTIAPTVLEEMLPNNFNNTMEFNKEPERSNNYNNTMQFNKEPERSITPTIAPTVLEEMPPLVKRVAHPSIIHNTLESEVDDDDELIFSDDEAMLIVNEDELLEFDNNI